MENEGIFNDQRFSTITTDPKFKQMRKHERKVKIDNRFRSMFHDKKFKVKYSIDKRGRPLHRSTTEDFKKFYDLPSDEDDNSVCDKNEVSQSERNDPIQEEQHVASEEVRDIRSDLTAKEKRERKSITTTIRTKLKDMGVDYARGESNLFSESSSDEPESDESESESEVDHKWGELDNDAVRSDNVTSRLAVCNLDWDRIRAEDLMILFHSFLPSEGVLHSVTIYPSEFGLKRMEIEDLNGPTELVIDGKGGDEHSEGEMEEGSHYHREKLRTYQLNRLKYYYAVAEFDSPGTASKVYNELDNMEYESSATRLDLRFIPDDVTFDQECREKCEELPDITKYKPRFFTTTALQQAKVDLTWDETDPKRTEFAERITEVVKSGDINDSDIEEFVALSSSEGEDSSVEGDKEEISETFVDQQNSDEGGALDPIEKYRLLLKDIEETEDKRNGDETELEITWGGGDGEVEKESREVICDKQEDEEEENNERLTPFQKLIQKKKEKRKEKKKLKQQKIKENNCQENDDSVESEDDEEAQAKKAELELLLMDEGENKKHFNLKKLKEDGNGKRKKRKRKHKDETKQENADEFEVDVNDERFQALYSSHLFNIDPTDSKFHKTKGMRAFVEEKQRRISNIPEENKKPRHNLIPKKVKKTEKHDPELSLLVKSIKNKTKNMLQKSL